jgi:nephrocystin-3
MQEERELLVKMVFPELRRVCSERFVVFTEVDLRWGITEEQQAEGKVLPICLEEIARSRPYFIGLLGERYGWIPDSLPPEVIAREPWLQEHVGGRTSVTELEILHGVLNNPAMADRAFFYFRDPGYVASLPEVERREMVERDIPDEVERFGKEEASRRTEEHKRKLRALKDRIRRSGRPVLESYPNPEALAAAVRRQFLDLIDRLYPKEEVPDALTREARNQEAYARAKLLAYLERPTHTDRLNAFVSADSTGQGLVITGTSGGGKTVLLAGWVKQRRQVEPDSFILEHYFGSTPESATVTGFISRVLGELKNRFGVTEEVPRDPAKLREALPTWLAQSGGQGRIVLVMDGLNQIVGDEADRRLSWLPRHFPSHVRVLASALPGPGLEALHERGWEEHELPLANAKERDAMVGAFLNLYGRSLRQDLRRRLVSAPGSANPLFLRTVLDELRQFGSFEELPREVARYLQASDPEELFRLVIRRWRKDFDGDREIVRSSLRLLWAARQGLSETEWLGLLSRQRLLPRQQWTPLFLAMEAHLVQRAGLFAFGHDYLRQALRAECVGDDEEIRACHLALAEYFEGQERTERSIAELPWQLCRAGERDRLRGCLLDVDSFLLMKSRDENELLGYWIWLGEERTMGQAYLESFEAWSGSPGNGDHEISYAGHEMGEFLLHASLYAEAEPLMRRALEIDKKNLEKEHPNVARDLSNLAGLLLATNRPGEAELLMRRALEIDDKSLGKEHPKVATDLNNLASLLYATNRLGEAEPLMRRALEIDEKSFGKEHLEVAINLNNLATLLKVTNRLGEAEPLMRRALEIAEKSLGKEHPAVAVALTSLASLLQATNRLAEAEPLMRRALEIDEKSSGKKHPKVARDLTNLAQLLQATNRLAEAEPLMRRVLEIDEKSLGKEHPDVAGDLSNLASLLYAMNRLAEAEPLMRTALEIYEKSLGEEHIYVATALNNLAALLCATNRLGEAEPLIRRAVQIYRASLPLGHPQTRKMEANLQALLRRLGRG